MSKQATLSMEETYLTETTTHVDNDVESRKTTTHVDNDVVSRKTRAGRNRVMLPG